MLLSPELSCLISLDFRLPQKECWGMLVVFFPSWNKTMPLSQKRVMKPCSIQHHNEESNLFQYCEMFLKAVHFALRGCYLGTLTQTLQTTSLGPVALLLGLLYLCLRYQHKLFRICLKYAKPHPTKGNELCTDEPANETSVTDHPKCAHVCLAMIP